MLDGATLLIMDAVQNSNCPGCGAQVSLGHEEFITCPYCQAEVRRTTPSGRQLLGQLGIRVAPRLKTHEELVEQAQTHDAERRRTTRRVLLVVFSVVGVLFAVLIRAVLMAPRGR
jgi:endogenous inhibitor of DNA gyrase (YacG/DUF329 family)